MTTLATWFSNEQNYWLRILSFMKKMWLKMMCAAAKATIFQKMAEEVTAVG